jgi:tRNA(fMet)-specific endonuclease VapC
VIVLDTDVLSIIQHRSEPAYTRIRAKLRAQMEVGVVTVITFEEQVRGWLAQLNRRSAPHAEVASYARLHELVKFYRDQPLLDFDAAASHEFVRLRKGGIRIGTMDLRIAAIALAHDALLISRNLVDFQKVPGLRVEDWTVN